MGVIIHLGFSEDDVKSYMGSYIMTGCDPVRKNINDFNDFLESYHDVCFLDVDISTTQDFDDLYDFIIKEKNKSKDDISFNVECNLDTDSENIKTVIKYIIKNIHDFNKINSLTCIKNNTAHFVKEAIFNEYFDIVYVVNEETVKKLTN